MRPGLPPFGQHCQPSHVGGQVSTDVDLVGSVKNIINYNFNFNINSGIVQSICSIIC